MTLLKNMCALNINFRFCLLILMCHKREKLISQVCHEHQKVQNQYISVMMQSTCTFLSIRIFLFIIKLQGRELSFYYNTSCTMKQSEIRRQGALTIVLRCCHRL